MIFEPLRHVRVVDDKELPIDWKRQGLVAHPIDWSQQKGWVQCEGGSTASAVYVGNVDIESESRDMGVSVSNAYQTPN